MGQTPAVTSGGKPHTPPWAVTCEHPGALIFSPYFITMAFTFSYPNTPYYLPTSSFIDISRVLVGTQPTPVFYSTPWKKKYDFTESHIYGFTCPADDD